MTLQTPKPTPSAPSPEAASAAAPPRPGLRGWASQPGPEGQLHPHPSQPPTPLHPPPVQPRDPPRVTAMSLREPRAPPHPGQPILKPQSGGGGGYRARQEPAVPAPHLARLPPPGSLLPPGLLWASSVCRTAEAWVPRITRTAGSQDGQSKKPLPSPASPRLGLWGPLGPGAGAGGSPGEHGHLPGQTEAQLREGPPQTPKVLARRPRRPAADGPQQSQ